MNGTLEAPASVDAIFQNAPSIKDGFTIKDDSVLVSVTFSYFGNDRTLDRQFWQSDAADEQTGANMKLINPKYMKKLKAKEGAVKRYLSSLCFPSPYKKGVYLEPLALFMEIDKQLQKFFGEWKALVADFVKQWPEMVDAASKSKDEGGLGPAFDPEKYPDSTEVASHFVMEWEYLSFVTPENISQVSPEMYEKAMAKEQSRVRQQVDLINEALTGEMLNLVRKLGDTLSAEVNGKPKIFRDSTVTNVTDFLSLFGARNLTNNQALAEMAQRAMKVLDGKDPDELRKNKDVRAAAAAEMSKITVALEGLAVKKPTRMLDFGD
jgi:hypothetical protein